MKDVRVDPERSRAQVPARRVRQRTEGDGSDVVARPEDFSDRLGQTSITDEAREIASRALALPELFINVREMITRDDAARDLVGEAFGVQIRMMSEDPHVPELVCDNGFYVLCRQSTQE